MIRLFVGLKIPYDICDELLLLCSGLENARWVKKENFHITLQFIGPVQESYIDDLIQCLSVVSFSQFSLTLNGINFFESSGIIRSIWVGVREKEKLKKLASKVSMSVTKTGIKFRRRKFTPHVSIARLAGKPSPRFQNYIEGNALFRSRSFPVKNFTLFESILKPDGPIYLINSTFPSN